MNAITIVLRSGMGMLLDSVRPYLKPGMPIAIGRAGAVIAEVAEGNAIEDKRLAAESAAGYIDSVERYVEGANTLESVVAGLENTLLNIERHAEAGQNGSALQAMDALRRIRELTAAFLDNSGARAERGAPASGADAEPAYPGAAAARRLVDPIKPGIFDVITGTACVTGDGSGTQLPPLEEHLAQVEQVAAGLREDQAELAESILVLEDWLERVEIEDGYVGVPVIEAVEVVVTELKRQQQVIHPVACRYDHWFAGDSEEASFIREHGVCRACAEVDSMLCGSPAEGGEA
ncbi:hypothetical protein QA447_03365 [Pseudomonas sp. abacavir_1]